MAYTQITVDKVRRKYPNPSAEPGGGYCVGGALCKYLYINNPQPSERSLMLALQSANKSLSVEDALSFACDIIASNDEGQFNDAWDLLDAALAA